jgi:hypothetical protein
VYLLSFLFDPADPGVFVPMILVPVKANFESGATFLYPVRWLPTVGLHQAPDIANASAFGNDP